MRKTFPSPWKLFRYYHWLDRQNGGIVEFTRVIVTLRTTLCVRVKKSIRSILPYSYKRCISISVVLISTNRSCLIPRNTIMETNHIDCHFYYQKEIHKKSKYVCVSYLYIYGIGIQLDDIWIVNVSNYVTDVASAEMNIFIFFCIDYNIQTNEMCIFIIVYCVVHWICNTLYNIEAILQWEKTTIFLLNCV